MVTPAVSPRVAGELLALLIAAGNANNAAARYLSGCTCGHPDTLHDLNRKGQRTACSVSTGPAAVPCGCPVFAPITTT